MKLGINPFKQKGSSFVKAALLALFAMVGGAQAGQLHFSDPGSGYRLGPGGEFQMNLHQGTGANAVEQNLLNNWATNYDADAKINAGFGVFCLEKSEFLNWNTTYNFAVSDSAKNGGGGAIQLPNGTSYDKISKGTAFLYSQYALGTLAGYDFTPGAGRAADATELQDAFWYLENEHLLTSQAIADNDFLQLLLQTDSLANWAQDANGAYGVGVLNITTLSGDRVQDQLVYLGNNGGSTPVPDGGSSAMLLGLSVLGLALTRRFLAAAV